MAYATIVQQKAVIARDTACTVTLDSTPTQGNLLVACVASRKGSQTTPSGWTVAVNSVDPNNVDSSTIFYKVAGASESPTVTFDDSSTTEWHIAAVFEVEGSNWTFDKSDTAYIDIGAPAEEIWLGPTPALASQPQIAFATALVRDDGGNGSSLTTFSNGFIGRYEGYSLVGPGPTGIIVGTKYVSDTAGPSTVISWNIDTVGEGCGCIATFAGSPASTPATGSSILRPGVRPGTRAGAIQ